MAVLGSLRAAARIHDSRVQHVGVGLESRHPLTHLFRLFVLTWLGLHSEAMPCEGNELHSVICKSASHHRREAYGISLVSSEHVHIHVLYRSLS